MNLNDSDFTLFDVPERFAQDRGALDARWKMLQREAHPDRFAGQGAAAQRIAMQWSVRITEAYQRLKEPLKRAAYLCELHGAPIKDEDNKAMTTVCVMRKREWREAVEDANSVADGEAVEAEARRARKDVLKT